MNSIPTRIEDSTIARLRLGDEAALESVFRSCHAMLCAYTYRYTRSAEAAEDIVQEIFLELWRRRSELRIETSLNAYLYTAARNRALNHLGRAQRETRHAAESSTAASGVPASPADPADSAERIAAVQAALAKLPERAREVAELRWRQQLSYDEIATIMGISAKGVENQLGRVRKVLREKLRQFRGD